nr:GspH/FimT family pseudopilin [Desulfatitalea alkaliphila]
MNGSEATTAYKKVPWPNGKKGFTLVELMVTIAIIAILLGVATPAMVSYMQQKGVRDAADQLAMDFQRAKMLAISRSAPCSIIFDTANNRYTISLTNQTIDLVNYRGGVTFAAPFPDPPQVTFNPQGTCFPASQLFLTNAAGSRTLGVRTSIAGGITQF